LEGGRKGGTSSSTFELSALLPLTHNSATHPISNQGGQQLPKLFTHILPNGLLSFSIGRQPNNPPSSSFSRELNHLSSFPLDMTQSESIVTPLAILFVTSSSQGNNIPFRWPPNPTRPTRLAKKDRRKERAPKSVASVAGFGSWEADPR